MRIRDVDNVGGVQEVGGSGELFVHSDIKSFGVTGDGTTDDYDAISNALTAIGSDETTLIFPAGNYYIGTNVSVPENIHLVFERGAVIQDNGDIGRTFTVASSRGIEAGPWQIFNLTGAGSQVIFTNDGSGWLNWWCDDGVGTSGDPWTSASNTAGISDAVSAGLTDIRLTTGEYNVTAVYDAGATGFTGCTLRGEGSNASIINYTPTTGDVLVLEGTQCDFRDFRVVGPGTGGSENALVLSDDGGTRNYISRVTIKDVGGYGLTWGGSNSHAQGVIILSCGSGLMSLQDSGGTVSIGGGSYLLGTEGTTQYGIVCGAGNANNGLHICDTNIENCSAWGIYSGGAFGDLKNVTMTNVHMEKNGDEDTETPANSTGGDIRASSTMESLILNGCRLGGNSSHNTPTILDLTSAGSSNVIINGGWWRQSLEQINFPNSNTGTFTMLAPPYGLDPSLIDRTLTVDVPVSHVTKWLSQRIDSVSTSGTGEDDLASTTLPQDSHLLYRVITVEAAGTKTGTNGNKTIKFHFGASEVEFHPAQNNAEQWQFRATIMMKTGSSHLCMWDGLSSAVVHGYEGFTDDLTAGDITLKLTGECADAGDTITQTMFVVKLD